jgi:hypothetical protein
LFPELTQPRAGGQRTRDVLARQCPNSDPMDLIRHIAVLQHDIALGKIRADAIDFVEAAKPIPFPVR